MKNAPLILVALSLCAAGPAFAADYCSGVAGNIVANCGFENGVYTSTVGGSNPNTPVSWTGSAGWAFNTGWDTVTTYSYSGTYAVSIGNDNGDPLPTLSQTLTDVSGASYSGSLFVSYGGAGTSDPTPFFNVTIDGTDVLSLTPAAPLAWTEYTFSFTGTGSDTLSFGGNTNPSEWYVDSFVVTPTVASTTPEPSSLLLLGTAAGPLMWLRRKFAKR
jgi:hypothetical protein